MYLQSFIIRIIIHAYNLCYICLVDVPGCEPYREYLYTYLRDQPIWHTLRFWNAAFFDAVQCERNHRPIPKINKYHATPNVDTITDIDGVDSACAADATLTSPVTAATAEPVNSAADDVDGKDDDDSTSMADMQILQDDQIFLQNICFGQLGFVHSATLACVPYRLTVFFLFAGHSHVICTHSA